MYILTAKWWGYLLTETIYGTQHLIRKQNWNKKKCYFTSENFNYELRNWFDQRKKYLFASSEVTKLYMWTQKNAINSGFYCVFAAMKNTIIGIKETLTKHNYTFETYDFTRQLPISIFIFKLIWCLDYRSI